MHEWSENCAQHVGQYVPLEQSRRWVQKEHSAAQNNRIQTCGTAYPGLWEELLIKIWHSKNVWKSTFLPDMLTGNKSMHVLENFISFSPTWWPFSKILFQVWTHLSWSILLPDFLLRRPRKRQENIVLSSHASSIWNITLMPRLCWLKVLCTNSVGIFTKIQHFC